MENELDLLLGKAIDSLLKLDLLLYLQRKPGFTGRAQDFGEYLRRTPEETARALEELAEIGLVERFALGTGKYILYGQADDRHVRQLLDLLAAKCSADSEDRSRVIGRVLRKHGEGAEKPAPTSIGDQPG